MRFVNESIFDAELFRTELPSGRMMASLLVRVAYSVSVERIGPLPVEPGAMVRRDRCDRPDGVLDPDIAFPRTATDLIVFGDAQDEAPAATVAVSICVGPYRHALAVHGDRVWERGVLGGLRPSPPARFTSIPLAWGGAFGGEAPAEHGAVPYPSNPRGRGYYLRERDAVEQPLPNIEWAGEEVQRWDARPEPAIVGPYPSSWWARLSRIWEIDASGRRLAARPEAGLFDQAHPRLSGAEVRPGDPIRIAGLGPQISATTPLCPVAAEFILGPHRRERADFAVEEIVVDARARRLEIAWRKTIQYEYVRNQERATILKMGSR
ncbi:MAG: DUF2169 domain-containing protein [Nannocystis sp.]|nr:DUF2169 domain-containing protein [Nannocystis sp.]